jgi:hypothetical protein
LFHPGGVNASLRGYNPAASSPPRIIHFNLF